MAIWPDIATWIGPSPNEYPGAMGPVAGLVLHIQEGTEAGTEAWQHNPASKVSSHFLAPKAGGLRQMLDTRDAAWAEVAGNLRWISVEIEGYSGQAMTDGQIHAIAALAGRLHTAYGIPLQPCDDPLLPGAAGITGHGLGGAAWGGHYDCPGQPILAQRGDLIDAARTLLGTPATTAPTPVFEEDPDMPTFHTGTIAPGFEVDDATLICPPPANTGPNWGNVWISFGADFTDAHLRIAYLTHGHDWTVLPDIAIPRAGDRINPFNGPAPDGIQKISVRRIPATPDDPGTAAVGYLIEAAPKPKAA